MADIKVRKLDERVAAALRTRAERKGISLEEEVRRTLAESVDSAAVAFLRRAAALRTAIGGKLGRPELDSARLIKQDRDARG